MPDSALPSNTVGPTHSDAEAPAGTRAPGGREAHAEAEAGVKRQQLRKRLQEAPACMASLAGPAHMVTVANKLFRQLCGGRLLTGLPLCEALPELEDQPFFALLDDVYRTGETCYGHDEAFFLSSIRAGLRGQVYFHFIAQAARDAVGAAEGILLSVYNVSAHVQARQQRKASGQTTTFTAQQLALANEELAAANEELSVSNEELAVTTDQLGQTNDQLTVANEHLLASNNNLRAHARDLRRTQLALRELNIQLESRVAARTIGLQTALRDTEQANAALSLGNGQLSRANQDLDSFVYAASHDLKLPVLNLAGLFEELRRSVTFADPGEEQLLVPRIQAALRQLNTTLDELAALGQAQEVAVAAEPVDLEEMVQDVLCTLEPQARAAAAHITTDFAASPTVSYSRPNLRTVLLNLLSNALKYADPARPARIHLSVRLAAGQPVLQVQDNGLGFDAAAHGPQLFQLFRRFHSHTEGTGVGLYLVNRLVLAGGGHVEVESRVGEGATFRVYFGCA